MKMGKNRQQMALRAFVVGVALAVLVSVCPVMADNGYVLKDSATVKAEDMPVCKEMQGILNLPENAHTVGIVDKAVIFPVNHKNIKFIGWTPISQEEVEELLGKDLLTRVVGMEMRGVDPTEKDKEPLLFEKTKVNFDNTGNIITMIHVRHFDRNGWDCLLGDDAPPKYFNTFNGVYRKGVFGSGAERCTVFTYGDRLYIGSVLGGEMAIYRPKYSHYAGVLKTSEWWREVELYNEHICSIDNPNAAQEYNDYLKQQGKGK